MPNRAQEDDPDDIPELIPASAHIFGLASSPSQWLQHLADSQLRALTHIPRNSLHDIVRALVTGEIRFSVYEDDTFVTIATNGTLHTIPRDDILLVVSVLWRHFGNTPA